jgi:hypothetical protein
MFDTSVRQSSSPRSAKTRRTRLPGSKGGTGTNAPKKRKLWTGSLNGITGQEEPSFEAIAILAALLDPKTAASNKPGSAIRRAFELVRNVPHYLTPQFEDHSTDEMRTILSNRARRHEEEDAKWERDTHPLVTYTEAVAHSKWCRFKTDWQLFNFMTRHGYPARYFPRINRAGYEIAISIEKAAERESERLRKKKARSQKEKKQNRSGTNPHNFRTKTPNFRTKP